MSVMIAVSEQIAEHLNQLPLTYSWDVESDAGEWAFALSGIRTARRKLTELTRTLCP